MEEINLVEGVAEALNEKPEVELDHSPVAFQGLLQKNARNRTPLAAVVDMILGPDRYKDRTVKLHESGNLQYWDGQTLKGSFSLLGATVGPMEGKECGMTIRTTQIAGGEAVQFLATSVADKQNWVEWISSVAEGKVQLIKNLASLAEMIGLEEGKKFSFECDKAVLTSSLIASGYTEDRFAEIFYGVYFENLLRQLKELLAKDDSLASVLKSKLEEKLQVCIKLGEDPASWNSGMYFRTSVPEGVLTVEYKDKEAYTNIQYLGSDLCENMGLMPSGLPYDCDLSARNSKAALDSLCSSIDAVLGADATTTTSFDGNLPTHYPLLKPNSYDNSRLGEIFLEVYPKGIADGFRSALEADAEFPAKFLAKCPTRKIALRYNPEMSGKYHAVSFDDEGVFVLEFRGLYTNVNQIPEVMTEGFQVLF